MAEKNLIWKEYTNRSVNCRIHKGEAIMANTVKGIQAGLCNRGPEEIVSLNRTHNNANVFSLGARFLTEQQAFLVVRNWLQTPYPDDERHRRRIEKIRQPEYRD